MQQSSQSFIKNSAHGLWNRMPVFLNERFDKSVPIFKFTNKTHFHVFISILVLLQQTPFSL